MNKVVEKYLVPFLFKHPALLLILAIMTIWGIWGYYDVMAEVEKQNTATQSALSEIKGELKGMAKFFTGEDSFKDRLPLTPPPEYFVGEDSIWLTMKYDSCKCGFITDSTQIRPPWHCWYRDSDNKVKMKTFR